VLPLIVDERLLFISSLKGETGATVIGQAKERREQILKVGTERGFFF